MPSVHTKFFPKKTFVLWKGLKCFAFFFLAVFCLFGFFQETIFINPSVVECLILLASLKIWGFDSLCGPYPGLLFLLIFNKSCFFSGSLQNICSWLLPYPVCVVQIAFYT